MLQFISPYNTLQTLPKLFLLQDDTITTGNSTNSIMSTMTMLWAGCQRNWGHFLVQVRHIFLFQSTQTGSEDQPASYLQGCRKQLGHNTDQSFTSSTQFKNEWSYTFTPPICLDGTSRHTFAFGRSKYTKILTRIWYHDSTNFSTQVPLIAFFIAAFLSAS